MQRRATRGTSSVRASRRRWLGGLAAQAASLCCVAAPRRVRADDAPAIAAASDLQFALPEIAEAFRAHTGRTLRLSFGSSGNFTHQIEQGAPFEVFLCADEQYVFRLAERGFAADRGTLYAIGAIALFAARGSALHVDSGLRDLKASLADGRLRRFAIANPAHAPYGRAARAALEHAGLWAAIESKLVFGEHAAQAAQFAASGSAQGGIVPWVLSRGTPLSAQGAFARIDPQWHASERLHQRMVRTRRAGETAHAFYEYMGQATARAILVAHRFGLPESGER